MRGHQDGAAGLYGYILLFALAFFTSMRPASAQTLTGAIDIHAHSDPDGTPRSIDAIDLAKLAKRRGMRAIVLKNHYEPTASLAYIVRKEVPGIEVFGGMGVSDDTPLAYFYVWARSLRIADGPDAVHRRSIARDELRRGEVRHSIRSPFEESLLEKARRDYT